jgi:hypothetical protein
MEAEGAGGCVFLGEVGVEHRRIVSGEGAEDAALDELRQRMLLERRHDAH